MRTNLLVGAAVAAGLAAGGASADPAPSGWYAALDLGANLRQDGASPSALSELGARPAAPRFHTNADFAGLARLGYKVTPRLRVELETGWRTTRMLTIVDEFPYATVRPPGSMYNICRDAPVPAGSAPSCGAPAGGVEALSVMTNAYVDLQPWRRIHPFAGIGVGAAQVRLRTQGQLWGPSAPLAAPNTIRIDDADWAIAYQVIGGFSLRINDRWSADLDYHLLYSGPHHWNTTTASNIQLGRLTGHYEDHTLSLGFRYTLSPPPAASPSPEAPAVSRP